MPALRRAKGAAAGGAGCFETELDSLFRADDRSALVGSEMASLHDAVPIVPHPAKTTAPPSVATAANIRTLIPADPSFLSPNPSWPYKVNTALLRAHIGVDWFDNRADARARDAAASSTNARACDIFAVLTRGDERF